ncbi:MAG TPA: prepilin peptidase [Firmicutes bacterium]|nr:prepilin peptidase [Bacillota bacterium]
MALDLAGLIFVAAFALVIGSFLNVCIYRVPRKESLAWPSSHCPTCSHPLSTLDLIPVFSFLFLRGRCRHCKALISWRYPVVESLTAVLWILVWLKFGLSLEFLSAAVFLSLGIIITFIDLDQQIIPDVISLPGVIIGLLLALLSGRSSITDALIGAFGGAAALFLVAFLSRGGMGGGDAKLLAMIGAFLGWQGAAAALMIGSVAGAITGLLLIALKVIKRHDPVPFGPFLIFGAGAYLFFGEYIIDFYTMLVSGWL